MKILLGLLLFSWHFFLLAQDFNFKPTAPCCISQPGTVWHSKESIISSEKLAALCAPIIWYSPDEPNLYGKIGRQINIPDAFPFQIKADSPVVYYRIKSIYASRKHIDSVYIGKQIDKKSFIFDLSKLDALDIDFFFYYPTEEGLGSHLHDLESVFFKLRIIKTDSCSQCRYAIKVKEIIGRAHGLPWYDNHLTIDEHVKFPMSILVEEGKHACCPDKNADGIYTPGFDVNKRKNDAWGIRDVIRSGRLFSGKFQSFMIKKRTPCTLIVPPLPKDSPLYDYFLIDGRLLTQKATYTLRPFPSSNRCGNHKNIQHMIEEKGSSTWPRAYKVVNGNIQRWENEEKVYRSISVAYRYDGQQGIVVAFPLLLFKNVEVPISGGWLTQRLYLSNNNRFLGHGILYTSSASRWVDHYIFMGYELSDDNLSDGINFVSTDFVTEFGLKLRFNINYTPFRFLRKLGTDFWGVRVGIRNIGFAPFKSSGIVIEIGSGVW